MSEAGAASGLPAGAETGCPNCARGDIEPVAPYLGSHEIFRRMSLGRCRACGLTFAQPQPSGAELARYYDHYWDGEVAVSLPSTRRYYFAQALSRVRYLQPFIAPNREPRVLDMGAGLGLFHDAMLRLGRRHEYVAVETDRTQYAALRARLGDAAAFGALDAVPGGRAFDLIVLAHVLEHISRPHEFIDTLVARLAPGGVLFIEVPNGDHRYKNNFESHLLFFDPGSLRALLARHGDVLDVNTVGAAAPTLRITQVHPERSALRPLKELVKTVIAVATPDFDERQIKRYAMGAYGGDRQWLRAVLAKGAG